MPAETISATQPAPASAWVIRWRATLEARWSTRLRQLTELSLAYHDAAATAAGNPADRRRDRRLQRLLNQAVAARQALADTEDALARLSAGRFGRCEQCSAALPAAELAVIPEARYCPLCTEAAAPGRAFLTAFCRAG